MDISEVKNKIREIEKERSRLADERDELQKIIREDEDKKDLEIRKEMVGKCYCSLDNNRYGSSYKGLMAFRVDEIGSYSHLKCLCILKSNYENCDYFYLDKMTINPFIPDCNMLMIPKNCLSVIDGFKEIDKEKFDSLCHDVVEKLMEKGAINED